MAIDRNKLVQRHAVELTATDEKGPLQVGNGSVAFNADITGLQTFFPFNTLSQWGWHSEPLPPGVKEEDFKWTEVAVHGRRIPYTIGSHWNGEADLVPWDQQDPVQTKITDWLYANPFRLNLGRLKLILSRKDGSLVELADLRGARQQLDLWSGLLTSRFEIEGVPVEVQTCCHGKRDAIAVRIESQLMREGRLAVGLDFPAPDAVENWEEKNGPSSPREYLFYVGRWDRPDWHRTRVEKQDARSVDLWRDLGTDGYAVRTGWAGEARWTEEGPHRFKLLGQGDTLECVVEFSSEFAASPPPSFQEAREASALHWRNFWTSGGAIDLSGSTDLRATELERLVVVSQYATAVNCTGPLPPQESGLVSNSWHGKFHLEMHWWHAAHYGLWNRWPLWEKSLDWYQGILDSSRDRARRQGYAGARWPKEVGPDGRSVAHVIDCMLIWQQPHPIFYAEMAYRHAPTRETLENWRTLVFETADFMASYAEYDAAEGRYNLGPALHIVAETTHPMQSMNPAFELSYWRFGLRVAQEWRERLGLPRDKKWQQVLAALAPLPVEDGSYVQVQGQSDCYTKFNIGHPAQVGVYGMLPGDGVEIETSRRSLSKVFEKWDLDTCWGWDFPLLAMAAARLGERDLAVKALLTTGPKFAAYRSNGIYTFLLPYSSDIWLPYLPANGGLLYAVAMMAGGWEGSQGEAPGFPREGWRVKWESLSPAL